MPRPEVLPGKADWKDVWEPEYQALFASLTDITALKYRTESENILDLTDIDSDFPTLTHYKDLARLLQKYSILLPSPKDNVNNPNTTYRIGPSFPEDANPTSKEYELKYDQEIFYYLCRHINRLCETADEDGPVTKDELADSVKGWYPDEDDFDTFLSLLEDYRLLQKIDPEAKDCESNKDSNDSEEKTLWAIGKQRSVNRDIMIDTDYY